MIGLFNRSTKLPDADVRGVVPALEEQLNKHFAPRWGGEGRVQFFDRDEPMPQSAWPLGIFDHARQAGFEGYHDTSKHGRPQGKVFIAEIEHWVTWWTLALSHELLELRANPKLNRVFWQEPGRLRYRASAWLAEPCDPGQDKRFAYRVQGVWVSHFVFPSWYEPDALGQLDLTGMCQHPFDLLPGGYAQVFDVGSARGWHEIDERGDLRPTPPEGTRRQRALQSRSAWRQSEAHPGEAVSA